MGRCLTDIVAALEAAIAAGTGRQDQENHRYGDQEKTVIGASLHRQGCFAASEPVFIQ